jgi:hypothetical protein
MLAKATAVSGTKNRPEPIPDQMPGVAMPQ